MKIYHWTYVSMLFAIVLLAFSARGPKTRTEAEPVPTSATALPPSAKETLPPATTKEADVAVRTVFEGTVVPTGSFVSADLNGDGSEDLIIPVKIRPGQLEKLSSDLANWTVQDVFDVDVPPPQATTFVYRKRYVKPSITYRDALVAVIHGYGSKGWRETEARQAYILVNVSETRLSIAAIHDLEARGMNLPRESLNPTLAITSASEDHRQVIYWTGARYVAADVNQRPELIGQNRKPILQEGKR